MLIWRLLLMNEYMRRNKDKRLIYSLFTCCYLIALYFFYIKYIPLIKPFQFILVPLFSIVFLLTAINVRKGVLFFIFIFPLINNVPYFFGIFEETPHAPTALSLFLFFFLGWLVHKIISPSKTKFCPKLSVVKPMIMFSIIVVISGIISFLKFANFYPFFCDGIYEFTTNIIGVTAGGAIMSTLFFSLNYLTGFCFFLILLSSFEVEPEIKEKYVKRIIITLLSSTAVSLIFAFVQHFVDISIGNTPMRIQESIINSTFKDPLSFGGYLSVFIPFVLGITLAYKGILRIFSIILFIAAVFILPQTGLRSGLVAVPVGLLLFFLLILPRNFPIINLKSIFSKRAMFSFVVFFLIVGIVFSVLVLSKDSMGFRRLQELKYRLERGGMSEFLGIRWSNRWRMAVYMMRDYPISGLGMGTYIIELPNYSKEYKSYYYKTDSAENYFVQVGAELGFVGLFFSFWIFWEIIKLIGRSVGRDVMPDRRKNIQFGTVCGIISLLIIFLFHTYIGSYEIKYTFWLLVGLLFMLGRKHYEKVFFSRSLKILCLILIVFFSGAHLWNSTHSLSLKTRTEKFGLNQNFGLYQSETTEDGRKFQWTREHGGISLSVEKPVIEIPLHASHPDINKRPVKVRVYLVKEFFKQKRLLDEISLSESVWKTYEYSIPEEVGNELILFIKVSRTWNPQKVLGIPDPRNLGVALGEIEFKAENSISGLKELMFMDNSDQ